MTISQNVTVTSLGVVGQAATGAQGILALYSNSGGAPGTLVAQTASTTINAGANQIPVTSAVPVAAGTYWILAEYNATAAICIDNAKTNLLEYTTVTTYGVLPTTFGAPTMVPNDVDINYYVFGILP